MKLMEGLKFLERCKCRPFSCIRNLKDIQFLLPFVLNFVHISLTNSLSQLRLCCFLVWLCFIFSFVHDVTCNTINFLFLFCVLYVVSSLFAFAFVHHYVVFCRLAMMLIMRGFDLLCTS
jgi:hypothetical protein